MRPRVALILTAILVLIALVASIAQAAEELPRMRVKFPDCGEFLCVLPRVAWDSVIEEAAKQAAELEAARKRIDELERSNCGKRGV